LRRTDGGGSVVDAFREGQGDAALNEFRSVSAAKEEEEIRLLRDRNANEERGYDQSKAALILGSVPAMLITAVSGWLVLRDQGRAQGSGR
jgi:hypothetical protein